MISKFFALVCVLSADLIGAEFDHSLFDKVLKKVNNQIGEVDYAALKQDRKDLDEYVKKLAEASPDNRKDLFPTRNHELAYWINAYNALILKEVTDSWPTKSVRDLGAFKTFFLRRNPLGGVNISFRALEFDIILKRYKEPRIHFAIVCASVSCPVLPRDVFTGDKLEAQLDAVTRRSMREKRILTINAAANELTLTSLFDWYKSDFGDVLAFLKKYASDADRTVIEGMKNPRMKYYDYDWSVNEPGSRSRAKSPVEREVKGAS